MSRRTAEEVSSSESDDGDVEEMSTGDEEELWRRVERDGFSREDTEVGERPDGFPRKRTSIRRQACGLHHHSRGEIWEDE